MGEPVRWRWHAGAVALPGTPLSRCQTPQPSPSQCLWNCSNLFMYLKLKGKGRSVEWMSEGLRDRRRVLWWYFLSGGGGKGGPKPPRRTWECFRLGRVSGEAASSHDHGEHPPPSPSPPSLPSFSPCLLPPPPLGGRAFENEAEADPHGSRMSLEVWGPSWNAIQRLFPNETRHDGGGGGGGGAGGGLPYLRHPGRQRAARSYRHRQLCAERRRERVCVTPGKPARRTN